MSTILVKIGGRAAENDDSLRALGDELAALRAEHRLILVHGGGAEVTAVSKRLGIEPVFKDGIRQTSAAEMDIVEMVLAGKMNKRLVRLLRTRGLDAVGLSGSDGAVFTGAPLGGDITVTRSGDVTTVEPRLLEILLDAGFLPVLCSASMDAAGNGLNINADTAAFRIAIRMAASALVFFSDIPGILSGGSVIQTLSGDEARDLVTRGVIAGGMLPKVSASLDAIEQGVRKVIIGQYDGPGALARLLDGKQGTRLWK
jgi:acetylglutamate kinase